ncbi:MAG: hypothetical protein E7258_02180 [Lachnospiraceae bacterium]|nr:hypothetical protein [Lachnospiraceae bacterium]
MKNTIICNKCKKELPMERGITKADFIEINKKWGYFSKKDGKTCRFILCESCSDELISSLAIPAEIKDTTELL